LNLTLLNSIVVFVDTVRHFEQAFGDSKTLACRYTINRHQSGGRATIAGNDDFTLPALLDGLNQAGQ